MYKRSQRGGEKRTGGEERRRDCGSCEEKLFSNPAASHAREQSREKNEKMVEEETTKTKTVFEGSKEGRERN